jgi:hypothetical protein
VVVALGPVRLSRVPLCADTAHNVFYAAHTEPRLAQALARSYWSELGNWRPRR